MTTVLGFVFFVLMVRGAFALYGDYRAMRRRETALADLTNMGDADAA